MSVNVLTHPIEHGVPLIVLSPHLDDAALSCGAVMIYAASRTPVTVDRRSLPKPASRRIPSRPADTCSRSGRRAPRLSTSTAGPRTALRWKPIGITCVHAGLTEALFRRRPPGRRWARCPAAARACAHLSRLPPAHHRWPHRLPLTPARCTMYATWWRVRPALVRASSWRPWALAAMSIMCWCAAPPSAAELGWSTTVTFPTTSSHVPDDDFMRRHGLGRDAMVAAGRGQGRAGPGLRNPGPQRSSREATFRSSLRSSSTRPVPCGRSSSGD